MERLQRSSKSGGDRGEGDDHRSGARLGPISPGVHAPFGTTPSTGGERKSDRAILNVNSGIANRRCRVATIVDDVVIYSVAGCPWGVCRRSDYRDELSISETLRAVKN